jgi:hypothetical protein
MYRIECPSCGHRLKYGDDHAGKKARCQKCSHSFRLPPLTAASPSESTAWIDSDQAQSAALARVLNILGDQAFEHRCQACFGESDEPPRYAEYILHIGLVFLFFHKSIRGQLCTQCRQKYFWDYTLLTSAFGWWGVISCVATPVVVCLNVFQHLRASFAPIDGSLFGPIQKVRGSSTALIAVGIANILFTLSTITLCGFDRQIPRTTWYFWTLPLGGACLASAVLTIVGALKMRKLRSYRLAMLACILVMVPVLSMCFIVGLPVGAIGLNRLLKADVRSAFA